MDFSLTTEEQTLYDEIINSMDIKISELETHCHKDPPCFDGSDCIYENKKYCPSGRMRNLKYKLENNLVFRKNFIKEELLKINNSEQAMEVDDE